MHLDQFNTKFAPFYVEFGYYGSVQLPDAISPATLAARMMTQPDEALAIASEHAHIQRLFMRLFWHTLQIGDFDCTQTQYDQEFLPIKVIEAAQAYQPPF